MTWVVPEHRDRHDAHEEECGVAVVKSLGYHVTFRKDADGAWMPCGSRRLRMRLAIGRGTFQIDGRHYCLCVLGSNRYLATFFVTCVM